MKTLTLTALVLPFIQSGVVSAAGNETLPIATFDEKTLSWSVTVPETWNFSTILNATKRAHAVDDPAALLSASNLPFPHEQPPDVFVNGTWSGYATNALNYAMLRELNASVAPYSDENWVLPVVCEWPISMCSRLGFGW
jgi:hypothetical protein